MVKGVSAKFKAYNETVPALLKLIKFDQEIKKYDKVVLKPNFIEGHPEKSTPIQFVEQVLRFCLENRNPGTEIVIAEGCDGVDTEEAFESLGYVKLSERYGVGLVDLNNSEAEEVNSREFTRFDGIMYPKILKESFVVSLPVLRSDEDLEIYASLDNMIGAFPARHYKGFFSKGKSKLDKHPVKHQIHDIVKCKMPELAIIDASSLGYILAGQPLEMDKQAAKILGKEWRNVPHLRLIDESFAPKKEQAEMPTVID